MATRFYLVPKIGDGSKSAPRRPKYIDPGDPASHGYDWAMHEMGKEPACILGVEDISDTDHAMLEAQVDVIAFPLVLSAQIDGADVAGLQSRIEALNIPADWLVSGATYHQVLRTISLMFWFMAKLRAQFAQPIFSGGVTLDSPFNALPVNGRNAITATLQGINIDTSSITGATTVRSLLKFAANRAPGNATVRIGGVDL